MKVLLTTDAVGGVWTYATELARDLGGYGIDVALAVMGPAPSPDQRREAGRIPNLRLFEGGYKLEWMRSPWEDVRRAGQWLLELEASFRPDVIHLNGYAHGTLPWKAPVLVVAHSCVLSWWRAVKREPAPPSWDDYRREVGAGIRAADVLVAPSRAMLEAIETHYGRPADARVIYNGRRAAGYAPAEKEPFVLTAGRMWDEAKNLVTLQKAAGRIAWPVYVAGEEQHPDGGRPATGGVKPLGKLSAEDLAGWFCRASIYALPARYEPFGLTALEAAISGCAPVLGDIASLREVWGDAAIYAPPDDPEALSRAIDDLIEHPDRRQELAARARRRAGRYTAERMTWNYVELYRELCAGSRKPTAAGASR